MITKQNRGERHRHSKFLTHRVEIRTENRPEFGEIYRAQELRDREILSQVSGPIHAALPVHAMANPKHVA